MSVRSNTRIALLVRVLLGARRSFGLPAAIVVSDSMPAFYAEESYDPVLAKKHGALHVVVGSSHYALCSDERDDHDHGQTPWTLWVTADLDEFVRRFFHDSLHGPFAKYPMILTTMLFGSLMQATADGRYDEWNRKQEQVREQLLLRLDRYLSGFRYRMLKRILSRIG